MLKIVKFKLVQSGFILPPIFIGYPLKKQKKVLKLKSLRLDFLE